ncbi:MAG: septal ring lytic transglycosylase RlpA family protein [Pseudomonadales bacterium]
MIEAWRAPYLLSYWPKVQLRFFSFLLLIGLTSSCAQQAISVRDGAPKVNKAELLRVPDAVPKVEKVTRAGNKNPYIQFGKTYHLLSNSRGYRAVGTASWYGTKFHGRNTANGDVYNMNAMTAAHKTLPIPCYVKVRNTLNNKTIVVRVNDRGPFHGNRIIDLSYAAAVKLGFEDRGTAPVEIEVVEAPSLSPRSIPVAESRAKNAENKSKRMPTSTVPFPGAKALSGSWLLQAGAFYSIEPAQKLVSRLKYITDLPIHIRTQEDLARVIYRVQIGPNQNRAPLEKLQREMLAVEMGKPFLVSQTQ